MAALLVNGEHRWESSLEYAGVELEPRLKAVVRVGRDLNLVSII